MLCTTCLTKTLPHHPLQSKEHILETLREGILSSSDICDIHKNISDARDILKAYDKEIRQLERTLAVIRSMAGDLKERIKETFFLLSPCGPLESRCIEILNAHVNSIAEQSSRWVSLSLRMDLEPYGHFLLKRSRKLVPALRSHPPRHIPSIKDITIKVQEIVVSNGEKDCYLLPSLLLSLHLPSLISITLASPLAKALFLRHGAFEALGDLFKKSHALTSLTLDGLIISDEDTVSLLRLVPSLTKLTIHERISKVDNADLLQPISRRFLQCLNSYDLGHIATQTTLTAQCPLLPKLKHLSLKISGKTFPAEDQDWVKLFVSVVLSRWFPRHDLEQNYGVESLKYVKLRVANGRVDKDIWDQLRCLDGMVVILEDSD
ncbi:hypothetical protein K435DRAFT_835206 [Dendrothele bispora CBS 962.96]|uniref:F-box domain-containing protein n=1 Tax=Dendrothele bispora (strain CBS 962.96) TaxID=1314807 RepID=A0A4S8MPN5_DENBC|nr:hypothetical protein K435DRAFT_835206 [Dendrothele bispora CBS 962.96]